MHDGESYPWMSSADIEAQLAQLRVDGYDVATFGQGVELANVAAPRLPIPAQIPRSSSGILAVKATFLDAGIHLSSKNGLERDVSYLPVKESSRYESIVAARRELSWLILSSPDQAFSRAALKAHLLNGGGLDFTSRTASRVYYWWEHQLSIAARPLIISHDGRMRANPIVHVTMSQKETESNRTNVEWLE